MSFTFCAVYCCSVECCCKEDDGFGGGADGIEDVVAVGGTNGNVTNSNQFVTSRSQSSIQHIRIPLGDKKPVKFR